jgi:hypothetical protein
LCVNFALSSVSFINTEYCLIVNLGARNKQKCWEISFVCYDPTFITPNYNRKQFYQHRHFYILHTGFVCAIRFLTNIFFFIYRNSFSYRNSYLYYACEKNYTNIWIWTLFECSVSSLFFTFKIRFEMQMRCWWLWQVIPTSLGGRFSYIS